MTAEHNKIARPELFTAHHDFADMLSELGWPEWPPEKAPQPEQVDWWKAIIRALPKRERYTVRKSSYPTIKVTETSGTFRASKTTLEKKLIESPLVRQIRQKGGGIEYLPDAILSLPGGLEGNLKFSDYPMRMLERFDHNFFEKHFGNEDDFPLFLDLLDDPYSHFFLQFYKSLYWAACLENSFQGSQDRPLTLVFGSRGFVDSMIWSYTIAAHHEDPTFTLPLNNKHIIFELFKESLGLSQSKIPFLDAVVLMGTSQQTAIQRGKPAGKKTSLSESPFFKDYSLWIAHWIENVWPKLHELYGTGLLVLNGERPIEENLETLIDYLKKITGLSGV